MIEFQSIAEAMAFWSRRVKPAAASFKLVDSHKQFGVTFYMAARTGTPWKGLWTRSRTIPKKQSPRIWYVPRRIV